MKILAIETSCDETAIAVAEFLDRKIKSKTDTLLHHLSDRTTTAVNVLSHLVSSQVKLHAKFGGVVPNLAKREHQKNLPPILLKALKEAGDSISSFQFPTSKQIPKFKIEKVEEILEREQELLMQFQKKIVPLKTPEIDAIAVTYGPGLAPALWVGINFAKALAYLWKKPLIPVNHMEGHLFSALLQKSGKKRSEFRVPSSEFPMLALLVSGGHTELVLMLKFDKYKILGETLDDAAGEAFDKVARLLGFPYPGGPQISREAEKMQKSKVKIKLPRPMLHSKDYNFSFSGLKTAVLYLTRDLGVKKTRSLRPAIAKEFQDAVVDVLVAKTLRAAKEYKVKTILLGGGVAANALLRQRLTKTLREELPSSKFQIPSSHLCGDNALMIAAAAHFQWASLAPKGRAAYFLGKKNTWHKVQAEPNLKLSS